MAETNGITFCQELRKDPALASLVMIASSASVYVDDREPNVEAAMACGMHGILFTDPPALRTELIGLGLFH